MRALLQRADGAAVHVEGAYVGGFTGLGLVVLVGITHEDTVAVANKMAEKVRGLRIFSADDAPACVPPTGAREVSIADADLPVLAVSQFTLYGATRKGRRPTWEAAAPGHLAEPIFEAFVSALRAVGTSVSTGIFGADMRVSLTNVGPMTLQLELNA